MKLLKPVGKDVALTGKYTSTHKGYDHSGKGDLNYCSSIYGKVTQAKNSETKNWINSGELTTNDYGNYIKIKGEVDGQVVYQLGAHFEQGTVLPVGTEVQRGQVVAQIGNTGNSTGRHCHSEYRDGENHNFEVEFVDKDEESDNEMEKLPKDSVIRDIYIFTRGKEYEASQDEVDRWLQENKNLQDIGDGILSGDARAKEHWLERWEIKEQDVNLITIIDTFNEQRDKLKEVLRPSGIKFGDPFATIIGKIVWLMDRVNELEEEKTPKVTYKYEGIDYRKVLKIGPLMIILGGGD